MVLLQVMSLGSSRGKGLPVKTMSRFARQFDGWQAGLVVVVTAVLVSLVVIPRPSLPDEIPLPQVDERELTRALATESVRTATAERDGLPFEVRSVGEALRQLGRSAAAGDAGTVARLQTSLDERLRGAQKHDPELLLQLRAYQAKRFVHELRRFEKTNVASEELKELGGDFLTIAFRAGWVRMHKGRPSLAGSDTVRGILFRKRWNDITKLQSPPYRLSLDEERAFHAFLFEHPVVHVPASHREDLPMRCRVANEYLLRKVAQLGALDPSYPTDYARGILLLRLGRSQAALLPLVQFLESNPDGPHTLRARNTLRRAQKEMHSVLTE